MHFHVGMKKKKSCAGEEKSGDFIGFRWQGFGNRQKRVDGAEIGFGVL